ncbi:MAG TPA: ferritin-like domain-containing protein [Opitutaceae bacterium]|jgi:ferritin-like metal-binding protein YciE
MAKIETLEALLVDELRDLYSAETQLVKALPKMAEAAHDSELRSGIESHLEQTKGHVSRLEQSLSLLGESPKGKTCQAMKGLVEEGEDSIDLKGPDPVQDASIIGAAQRVEHYEIAAYGTAREFARALGKNEIAELLQQTLEEEAATDKKLTALSKRVNSDALSAAGT